MKKIIFPKDSIIIDKDEITNIEGGFFGMGKCHSKGSGTIIPIGGGSSCLPVVPTPAPAPAQISFNKPSISVSTTISTTISATFGFQIGGSGGSNSGCVVRKPRC